MISNRLTRNLAVALCMLMIVSCASTGTTETDSTKNEISQDEYDVYNAVLQAHYGHPSIELLVIEDHTGIDIVGEGTADISQNIDDQIRSVKSGMSVNQDALQDFQHKNLTTYPLHDNFNVKTDVILLSQQDRAGVQPGSYNFYDKYPKSHGLILFSRVGFNKRRDRAVVYIGNQWGSLSGAGSYIALGKSDGKWSIQDEYAVWIS